MGYGKRRRRLGWFWVLMAIVVSVVGYLASTGRLSQFFGGNQVPLPVEGEAEFHFIDVGQGDAALIRTSAGHVLIDAGTNDSEDALIAYLKAEGIKELVYAVFTHPHEDHIGGADAVLDYCDVKNVIMPERTSTTGDYTRLMDAIEVEKAHVIIAEPEAVYTVGGLQMTILGPIGSEYKDINNDSIVLRVDFGESSVLYTGDAEDVSEKEMLSRYALNGKLDCDLLKLGHHGSDSSTTEDFLKAVSPTMAVISCGEGNSYGHPKQEILIRLNRYGIAYWRTDLEESIVLISDGETLSKES